MVEREYFNDDTLVLLENSSPYIDYELYTVEQGQEKHLADYIPTDEDLVDTHVFHSKSVIVKDNYHINVDIEVKWDDDYRLVIFHPGEGLCYALMYKDATIISGFHDKNFSFQEGDCRTYAYKNDNKLVIFNDGDVSSLVIIKKVSLTKGANKC